MTKYAPQTLLLSKSEYEGCLWSHSRKSIHLSENGASAEDPTDGWSADERSIPWIWNDDEKAREGNRKEMKRRGKEKEKGRKWKIIHRKRQNRCKLKIKERIEINRRKTMMMNTILRDEIRNKRPQCFLKKLRKYCLIWQKTLPVGGEAKGSTNETLQHHTPAQQQSIDSMMALMTLLHVELATKARVSLLEHPEKQWYLRKPWRWNTEFACIILTRAS